MRRDRNALRKNLNYKINVTQNAISGNRASARNELQIFFLKEKWGFFCPGQNCNTPHQIIYDRVEKSRRIGKLLPKQSLFILKQKKQKVHILLLLMFLQMLHMIFLVNLLFLAIMIFK